jgi:hypothetical protein
MTEEKEEKKPSWRRLLAFADGVQIYLANHPKDIKAVYAINRVVPSIKGLVDKMNEELTDIDIEHCATEKRGEDEIIIRDAQGLQFTKEKMKLRNKARSAFFDSEATSFTPYFMSKIPENISEPDLEMFAGIVIRAADVERIRAEREASLEASDEETKENSPPVNGGEEIAVH